MSLSDEYFFFNYSLFFKKKIRIWLIRWVVILDLVHSMVHNSWSLNFSSFFTQPNIPLLLAVKQSTLLQSTTFHSTVQSVCSFTFFSDGIHRLHAAFNVVSDVTVEQPGTRILWTHFHCLEKINTLDYLQAKVNNKAGLSTVFFLVFFF